MCTLAAMETCCSEAYNNVMAINEADTLNFEMDEHYERQQGVLATGSGTSQEPTMLPERAVVIRNITTKA